MNRLALALSCVLAMVPGVAAAALRINIGPDITTYPWDPAGEHFFDLVFHETEPNVNEGLFAYDLYIVRDRPGINLVRAEKPDNWVFTSPGASFQQADISAPPGTLVVNAIGDLLGANQDIRDGTKVARVFYTLDPNMPFGAASVRLDATPGTTLFVSGDTGEEIPVDISDTGAIIIIPEPAGFSLLGVACVFALRRRRAAAAPVA